MTALLDVKNLTIDIPVATGTLHAVRGISFQAVRGETLCIVGESGCGKSLTALAIMDLLPASAARSADRISFQGQDLRVLKERQMSDIRGAKMGMIFQEPMTSLNPAYSIGDQLSEMLIRHKSASRSEAQDRAVYLLEKVGITAARSRMSQYPHQLSGGLRQRVMIAMMLMCDPALIIADEPTTALDVTIQAQILLLLAELQKEFDMGLILITHDLGVVARIADRVAVMYAGQIVEAGTANEIFNKPTHPYTQGLLDCIPVPGKSAPGAKLGSIPGTVPSLVGDVMGCSFKDRCAYANAACELTDIELAPVNANGEVHAVHEYRCVLPADICAQNGGA